MSIALEPPLIRLHADANEIWLSGRDGVPVQTGIPPTGSVGRLIHVLSGVRRIHVLGCVVNVPVVMNLYDARHKLQLSEDTEIIVVSPTAGGPDLSDPRRVLFQMLYAQRCPFVGVNYIRFTARQYSSFALVAEMNRSGKMTDKVAALVQYHPAWPAISFVPTCDLEASCQVLKMIGDPRWFTTPHRPNRITPLQKLFGLNLDNVKAVMRRTKSGRTGQEACKILMEAWSPHAVDNSSEPNNFLQRIVFSSETMDRGLFKATKVMLRFVREVWLQNLSEHEKMFDPTVFFKEQSEWEAYEEHCAKLSPRIR